MNINVSRIKKRMRRIEAMVLAAITIATSLAYSVTATENNSEQQELVVEQEEESEQQNLIPVENTKEENIDLKESKEEKIPEQEDEAKKEEALEQGDEEEEIPEQEDEAKKEEALEQGDEEEASEIVSVAPLVEYSIETEADGYKIKLDAYEGVFPEGEDLSLSAKQIKDQDILDVIDNKLSDVCEGEFKQISFDIKVLNASGEELQPDRSNYIENEDIIPIQLSIELANDEIDGEVEVEVFHFADDLSSMECLVSTVDGDEVTVEPEHFSVFSILTSRDGGSYYNGLTPPTGYRTYIEWMPNSTASLRRLQKIYVYAQAGEQISFGSSSFINLPKGEVTKSLADSFGYSVGTAPTDASIAVTLPYSMTAMQEGTSGYSIFTSSTDPTTVASQIENYGVFGDTKIYLFKKDSITDVSTSTNVDVAGTIYNWQQEALGPNTTNLGGYVPISFKAPVTGVYTFRFFGTQYSSVKTAPVAKKTDAFPQKSLNYVGAWDITVTENATATTPITGRTFTDALFWTIGANISANEPIMEESVYALTSDGFEYKVDFNGMDPFGFVFYTNKRGLLVSSDDHEDGHYRSLARSVKSKRNQIDDLLDMGVHINSTPTTTNDESYFITFEKADKLLLKHYTNHENLADNESIGTNPAAYKDFKFKGLNSSDGEGTEGYGGYFSFEYDRSMETSGKILPSTYEIIIDFTGNEELEKKYGYAKGTPNEVILSNVLVNGTNKIFWNGKDEHGNVVIGGSAPTGISYDIASFNVKAGEVHFPLLDVENNRYGIKVEMQNNVSGIDKSKIYYDNSDSDIYGKNIGDKKEYLNGVSSGTGAMVFSGNAGDYGVIDIWADYRVATPIGKDGENNYSFTLFEHDNEKAYFRAQTTWQYFYVTIDGKRHFDASASLPKTAKVVLQYRVVDKSTAGIGGVNKEDPEWQKTDTGVGKDWQVYSGDVKVKLQTDDSTDYERTITLDPTLTSSFADGSAGGISYGSVTIESYRFDKNTDPATKGHYPDESSDGLCIFTELPLHPKDGSGNLDLSKFYQYRVVDIGNTSLDSYAKDELFDRVEAVEIPDGEAGHVIKDIYIEETLDYCYIGAPEFNLEFDQLWNDLSMGAPWYTANRPKAVQVAILYGVPKYEDLDKKTEYDTTIEKGYYGEDVEVVWRKIQQIDYLTLDESGGINCTDSKGVVRKLSSLSGATDHDYAAYYPVWKYMSNGDPYFYKIRPVSYSMDGINFSPVKYWDASHMIPKLSLPEFYGIDDDSDDTIHNKYHVVFYDEEVEEGAGNPDLYPRAVKFTDVPAKAEIKLTKTDENNNPIIGKATSYEITNDDGKNLMFLLDSAGNYTYKGLDGAAGLPLGVTKEITTSTLDSIVHVGGLPIHEYHIREVKAPEGYQLSSSTIDVIAPEFLSKSTSDPDGFRLYLCEKSQKDSRVPGKRPKHDYDTDGNEIRIENLITNTNSIVLLRTGTTNTDGADDSNDINGKKLPKTGGLKGSLAAMILGILMVGLGIYLTKPSTKKKEYRD